MTDKLTLPGQIARHAAERPERMALHEKGANGNWCSTTWHQYWQSVQGLANGLIALGMEPGEAVVLIGNNRPDWVISQMGISAGSGVPAPIYATNTIEQIAYIVNHCGAKIAICDNQDQLDKFTAAMDQGLMSLDYIITMDPLDNDREIVMSLCDVIESGRSKPREELERRMAAVDFDDLALLIYTSGTTGVPKGARCTHRGIDDAATSFIEETPECLEIDPYRYLSYLPLCHVAEQAFTNFIGLKSANETYFCADLTQVKNHLLEARPHSFFAVPRVWEKFEAAISAKFATATGLKAHLLRWARRVELDCAKQSMSTGTVVNTLQRRLANAIVLSKIRASLGLDEAFLVGSGAAPTARSTLEFFASLGILVHEGFGMTETYGVAMKQPTGCPRFGTVGKALPGMEVSIAEDGEILLRGPGLITGYQGMTEDSTSLYTQDRWMSTGDLGVLDADGFITITGRKKDLLITAGGKNIAPAEMENHLQSIPWVGQAVVVGDRQPYLCALLAIEDEVLPDLCKAAGVDLTDRSEIVANSTVRTFLADHVESHCNGKVARYQTIKKFEVFPCMLSVEGGELTPTLKIKRNIIHDKYRTLIESMYPAAS